MDKWILEDTYNNGDPKYFKQMTGIGPMATPNLEEAATFDSKEDALACPANRHWSANWVVKEAPHVKET